MAKFFVTYKSPDCPADDISEAKQNIPAGDVERVCDRWDIGEYLTLELDTEAMTCVVVPEKPCTKSDAHYKELTEEWQQERDAEKAEIEAFDAAYKQAKEEAKASGEEEDSISVIADWDMALGTTTTVDDQGFEHIPIIKKPKLVVVRDKARDIGYLKTK